MTRPCLVVCRVCRVQQGYAVRHLWQNRVRARLKAPSRQLSLRLQVARLLLQWLYAVSCSTGQGVAFQATMHICASPLSLRPSLLGQERAILLRFPLCRPFWANRSHSSLSASSPLLIHGCSVRTDTPDNSAALGLELPSLKLSSIDSPRTLLSFNFLSCKCLS